MSYINLHDSNLNSLNYQRSYTGEGYLRKGNILYIYIWSILYWEGWGSFHRHRLNPNPHTHTHTIKDRDDLVVLKFIKGVQNGEQLYNVFIEDKTRNLGKKKKYFVFYHLLPVIFFSSQTRSATRSTFKLH